jgi:hypothetical protein
MHRRLRYAPKHPGWLACGAVLLIVGALAALLRWPAWITTVALAAVLMAQIMRRLDCDIRLIALVLAGMALYVLYLSYTAPEQRNYDAMSQHRYLFYVAEHAALPPPTYCNICYHPPLYYVVAALWVRFLQMTHWMPTSRGLPLLSLAFAWVFIVFGILTVRRFTRRPSAFYLATALIVFWPSAIINSIRVHNDSLASALMAGAIYFSITWYQAGHGRDLLWAAVLAALALLTKGTGLVVVAVLVVMMAVRLLRPGRAKGMARWALVASAILGVAFVLGALRGTNREAWSWCQVLFGDACQVDRSLFVDNRATSYLGFDAKTFLSEPYLAAMQGTERNYFIPSLLKSSLFGTSNTVGDQDLAYPLNNRLAIVLNGLLVGMAALGLTAAGMVTRARLRRYVPVLGMAAMFIAGLAVFRLVIPSPHHNDFRHVFPLLILASLMYAQTVKEWCRRRPWLGMGMRLLALFFLTTSVLYFLPKKKLVCRHTTKATAQQWLGGTAQCP